jgi:hypothetical protein
MIENLQYLPLVIFFSLFYVFTIIHHIFYFNYTPFEGSFAQNPLRPAYQVDGDVFQGYKSLGKKNFAS